MEKAVLKKRKYETTLRKMLFMSSLIYISRHFWYFISSRIKRNNYEGPNYHNIVRISGICLQFENMNLCVLNQYPNIKKYLLLTQISSYDYLKTLNLSNNFAKITTLSQKFKVQVFLWTPFSYVRYGMILNGKPRGS